LGIAPLGIGRGAAAAGLRLVDDVVMDERGGVDDFNHGPEADGRAAIASEQLGREQQKRGAQTLAAAGTKVLADFGDDLDVGDGVTAELALDGGEIVAEQVEDLRGADCGGSGQNRVLSARAQCSATRRQALR
ncbi:MAG: hypothetical protein ACRD3E_19020, partial [Terriglobales bacterium]